MEMNTFESRHINEKIKLKMHTSINKLGNAIGSE